VNFTWEGGMMADKAAALANPWISVSKIGVNANTDRLRTETIFYLI
jgi:hypothetical protein